MDNDNTDIGQFRVWREPDGKLAIAYYTLPRMAGYRAIVHAHKILSEFLETRTEDEWDAICKAEIDEEERERDQRWMRGNKKKEKPPKRPPVKGYVYVMRIADSNLCKIGATTSLQQRIGAISGQVRKEIILEAAIPSNDIFVLEKEMHDAFMMCRTNGEWFQLNDDDLAYLKQVEAHHRAAQEGGAS